MKNLISFLTLLATYSLLTSCATIIGGSKYYAHVKIEDHPNAKIEYNDVYQGTQNAMIKIKRKEADKFAVTIKEEGCETQTIGYNQKAFRGWAFAGTVIGWTGLYGGFPLPWGVAVDLATGALWKPDINENGVTKVDYKNYNYLVDYSGCKEEEEISTKDNNDILSVPLLTKPPTNGLENQFYFRFGVSYPTNSYFGVDDYSTWDEFGRIGGVLEFGSIFMLNSLPLADGLRLGINVDYADLSYHQFSSTIDDSAIGIFKISSKVGPSISYSPVTDLVFDAYAKFKIAWVAGMAFTASDGTVEDDGYAGTLGAGYAAGVNIRYSFLMLGFEFNKDSMKLANTNNSDEYFGNVSDYNSDETPMPCYNLTLGFCF